APSPLSMTVCVEPATPEVASLAVKLMATRPLYQPLALAGVVGAPLIVGGVWSMLMARVFGGVSTLPAWAVLQCVPMYWPSSDRVNGESYCIAFPPFPPLAFFPPLPVESGWDTTCTA